MKKRTLFLPVYVACVLSITGCGIIPGLKKDDADMSTDITETDAAMDDVADTEETTYHNVFDYYDERFETTVSDEDIETSVDDEGYVYKDGYRLGKGDGASLPASAIVGAPSTVNVYENFSNKDDTVPETAEEETQEQTETTAAPSTTRQTVRYVEPETTRQTVGETTEAPINPETPAAPELVGY